MNLILPTKLTRNWNYSYFFYYIVFLSNIFSWLSLKNRDVKLIRILRFCYFSVNILSLKTYYQLSYVSLWLTGILLTIVIIKSWNVYFHFALDWSNTTWPIWWLRQSITSCKLNESVVAITNMNCVYILSFVWASCFWKAQVLLFCEEIHSNPLITLIYIKLAYTYLDHTLQSYLDHSYL